MNRFVLFCTKVSRAINKTITNINYPYAIILISKNINKALTILIRKGAT